MADITSPGNNQNIAAVGGTPVSLGVAPATDSIPVVVATDSDPVPVTTDQLSSITAFQGGLWSVTDIQGTMPWTDNVAQIGGAPIALGPSVMAGSVPVTMAANQPAITVLETYADQENDILSQILSELRVIRLAMVKLACDDMRAQPSDFAIENYPNPTSMEN